MSGLLTRIGGSDRAPVRHGHDRLAGALAGLQIAELGDEAVAGVGGQQLEVVVGSPIITPTNVAPGGGVTTAGQRLAVALAPTAARAPAASRCGPSSRGRPPSWLLRPFAACRKASPALYCSVAADRGRVPCRRAPSPSRRAPPSPARTGSSAVASSALAASRSTIGERRRVAELLGVGDQLVAHLACAAASSS